MKFSGVIYGGTFGHYVYELSWQATVWFDGARWHVSESSW